MAMNLARANCAADPMAPTQQRFAPAEFAVHKSDPRLIEQLELVFLFERGRQLLFELVAFQHRLFYVRVEEATLRPPVLAR